MTVDRRSRNYEPRFDIDRAFGERGERVWVSMLELIERGAVEIKHDGKVPQTGNVYIEAECRGMDGRWHPSGIWHPQLAADLVGYILDERVIVAAKTKAWRAVYTSPPRSARSTECPRGSNPTRGLIIPLCDLVPALLAAAEPV